jgi:hypothetical protein
MGCRGDDVWVVGDRGSSPCGDIPWEEWGGEGREVLWRLSDTIIRRERLVCWRAGGEIATARVDDYVVYGCEEK